LGPNADLVGKPGSRHELTTPALMLDLDAFERNLARMTAMLRPRGLRIRPHAKTHKCAEIARRQIAAGARGVSVATLHEAEALARRGVAGMLVTSPVVGDAKIARLAHLNAAHPTLMVVADNALNVRTLAAAARATGGVLRVLVDLDIGMHRTGVPGAEAAVALARLIASSDGLVYGGIQAYSGRVQHIETYADRERTYGAQLDELRRTVAALGEAGLKPDIVTGGGTGTIGIDCGADLITEHQAGSYIFMDVEYNAIEILPGGNAVPFETALTLRNSVVSTNAKGFVTIDGGYKCFATDGPKPIVHAGAPAGARYEFFGDEHGRLIFAEDGDTMPLGAAVELMTPHCDPTVNLHDYYHVVQGDQLVDIWPIDGRGVL
jgi:D-serine deaminase-like pyridoxal phosphate-dependent protein